VDLTEQIQKTERAKAKRSKAGADKKEEKEKEGEVEPQQIAAETDDEDGTEITREDDYLTAEELLYEAEKRRELERIKRQKKGE
jgi:hypothetical protein